MKQIVLQQNGDAAPRTTEVSMYPNIDDNYTVRSYTGERLILRSSQNYGIREFGSTGGLNQGLAIYGNTLFRFTSSTTQKIYHISESGIGSLLGSFTMNLGHANSLQFSPVLLSGQTFPYLYVAGLSGDCFVLEISASYQAALVQTIHTDLAGASDMQIGDDGYIWDGSLVSDGNGGQKYRFRKLRRVDVSEGDVTLVASDVIDEWYSFESVPTPYTGQGMLVKGGRIYMPYGNAGQKCGINVFDIATHRLIAPIDLTSYSREFEDMDIWEDSIILGDISGTLFRLKF